MVAMDSRINVSRQKAPNVEGYVIVLKQGNHQIIVQPEWVGATTMALGMMLAPRRQDLIIDNIPDPDVQREVFLPWVQNNPSPTQ